MPSATAVFRAVADFASLNRELDKTHAKMAALKKQGADPASTKSFEAAMGRMATAQSKLRGETDKLSDAFAKSERKVTESARKHADALKAEQSAANSKLGTLRTLADHLAELSRVEKEATTASRTHTTALNREAKALDNNAAAFRGHAASLRDAAGSADDASRSSDRFNSSVSRTGSSTSQSRSMINALSTELRQFSSSSNSSQGSLRGFVRALALLVIPAIPAFIGGLVGSLVALGGALVGVIGAAGPAAGAIAALGPAFLAAAGAVGTAALAFKGIGGALKALTAAQDQAGQAQAASMQRATAAARGLENAQNSLRSAERALANAQVDADRQVEAADKALTRAHNDVRRALADLNAERRQAVRDLEDMRNAEIDATLSVEAADIALIEAREEQQKLAQQGNVTDLDRRKAALRVAEAEQRLSEARLRSTRATVDNNEAQKAGVNGAPGVVAASQRIADAKEAEKEAERGLADARREGAERMLVANEAVVQAHRAVADALADVVAATDKQTAAQSKLNQEMSKLSPSGQQFVLFINSLLPKLRELSHVAQGAFLPGLEQAIRIVMPMIDTVAIPSVKAFGKVLSDLAIGGGQMLREFEDDFLAFGTGPGPRLVDSFGNTLLNLTHALINVSMAAAPLLEWLVKLTEEWSKHIKATTQAARDSGRLATFFEKVKDTLTLLGHILKNVGGILHSVFSAAAPMGKRLLETFEQVTKKTNEYLKTAEGTAKLKKYFDDMEPSIRIILHLLGLLGKSILATGASKTTYELLKTIQDVLVPAFQRLARAAAEVSLNISQQLIEILAKLADTLTNLIEAGGGGGLAAFVTVLNAFASVLKAISEVPFLADIGVWLLAIAGGLKAIKLVGKITGLSTVAGGLNAVGGRAASYRAGEAAPVAASPTSFVGGVRSGAGGEGLTPRTLTARAGAVVGARFAPGRAAPPVPLAPTLSGPDPMIGGTATPAVYPPGTSRSPAPMAGPSRLGRAAGAVGRGASVVGGVGAGIAGSIGGGFAGAAIGQRVGGDTGAVVGSIAGSIAGGFAPDIIAAGLQKIAPLAEKVKSSLGGMASTLGGAVAGAARGAVGGLGSAVGKAGEVAGAVGRAAGSFISLGVQAVAANAKQLIFAAGSAIVRGAIMAWQAAQWLLNAAMSANPIGIIIVVIAALVAAFIYAWTHSETFRNIVTGVLQAVGDFFVWCWDNLISPIIDFFVAALHGLGDAAMWLWEHALRPAFEGIGAVISWCWQNIVRPVIDIFVAALHGLGDAAMWLWDHAIRPAMDGIGAAIDWVWQNIIRPVFDAIHGGLQFLGDGFNAAVRIIGDIWNGLRRLLAAPVNFMIGTVWNNGIRHAWNLVAGILPGINPIGPMALIPEYATGGRVEGKVPGLGNKDTVPAMLTPGEYVISKPVVQKWGLQNIHAAHMAARSGSFPGLEGMFAGDEDGFTRVGFAAGGPIDAGLTFARQQHGKPYIWGGVGPQGYDCSGFISAITNVLTGRYPHSRIGATGSMPWPGFQQGLNSAFGVGWFNGNPGHTAGTLDGKNVESGGSPSMTKYVQNAAGATHPQFNRKMSLPQVGGQFIGGGDVGSDSGWLKTQIADWFVTIVNPLINRMPVPPPQWVGVPKAVSSFVRDKALEWFLGKAEAGIGPAGADNGSGPVVDQVRGVAARYGWSTGAEWDSIYKIVQKESSWNPNAANPNSSARGLFQKMTSIHGPIENTPAGQAEWGLSYIRNRYGRPTAAWSHHQRNNWYSKGGPVLRRASGGPVFGSGGTDSVFAMLSPGEFVIRREAADVLGPQRLQALNDLDPQHAAELFAPVTATAVPRFALGGAVQASIRDAISSGRSGANSVVHGGDTSSKDIVINTNIYNPVAETSSDSVASRMRTLSLMGAFS